MKTFTVFLKDNKTVQVEAKTYRHEGNQYVFDSDEHDAEVQFFLDSEVVGIVIGKFVGNANG